MKRVFPKTFAGFVKMCWWELLLPVAGPAVVFTVSYFVTNIGWRAIPWAIGVATFMGGLVLLQLYTRWKAAEGIMRGIEQGEESLRSVQKALDE